MITRSFVFVLIFLMAASGCFGMAVQSSGSGGGGGSSANVPVQSGGRNLTDSELILVIAGVVCGTVILLAILD